MMTATGKSRTRQILAAVPTLVFLLSTLLANLTHTCGPGHHARFQHDHGTHREHFPGDHKVQPGKVAPSGHPINGLCLGCRLLTSGKAVTPAIPGTMDPLPPAGCLFRTAGTLPASHISHLSPSRGPPSFS